MRYVIEKAIFNLFMIVILSSCSSSYVTIEETREYQQAPQATYSKILVIGVVPSRSLRESFENIFADSLQRHGVAAVASHTLIADLNNADQARIQALSQQHGVDAVAMTRVLSKSEHTSYKLATGHAEYRTVAETTTTAHLSTTVAMSGAGIVPGEMDSAGAILQTDFFDASSARLVWTAISHAAGANNDKMAVCWELSFALAKALGKDRLITITSAEVKIPKGTFF